MIDGYFPFTPVPCCTVGYLGLQRVMGPARRDGDWWREVKEEPVQSQLEVAVTIPRQPRVPDEGYVRGEQGVPSS